MAYDGSPMRVLIPVPDADFDTTEVAVPWRLLRDAGHEVVFATEGGGTAPACDPRLLSGVLLGQLGADPEPRRFYADLQGDRAFRTPIRWADIDPAQLDGLILPGGHAPGMRQYLGSTLLQQKVAAFWEQRPQCPVGAICHGVLVLARARRADGKSPIHDLRTTCLPRYMEHTAYLLTAWKLGAYYRTYEKYVEEEVKAALWHGSQFVRGPIELMRRGTMTDDRPAFVVEDGRYVSARWPGDAYLFARRFIARLQGK